MENKKPVKTCNHEQARKYLEEKIMSRSAYDLSVKSLNKQFQKILQKEVVS